jgi:type I restriction enzyme, S subunit
MEVKPGYKQTEVGVIPEDWEVKRIGNLQPFVTSGSRGWAAYYSDRGAPFIRITNLSRESIYLDLEDLRLVYLPQDTSESSRTELQDNDVLISITADIGIIGYVSEGVPKPAYINQHIALVRFDSSNTVPKFVSYFLASAKPQQLFRALTDSGAKAGMSLLTVHKIHLALPPLLEQRAIAEALSDADALIESLEQLIAKKRLIKQGAMQELLTGKKRLPGFSGEWEVKTLGENCEVITKGTTPTSIGRDFTLSGINFLKAESISESGQPILGKVTFIDECTHKLLKRSQLLEGDILISIAGVLGRVGFVEGSILPANTNQALAIIRLGKESEFERGYLFYYLRSPMIQKQIGDINVQAAQANISLQNVREFQINVPRLREEQTAIAAILSDMDAEIAALEAKLVKARQVKQGMMQELLTGRIRLV